MTFAKLSFFALGFLKQKMVTIQIHMTIWLLSGLKAIINAEGLGYYPEYDKGLINIGYCYYG